MLDTFDEDRSYIVFWLVYHTVNNVKRNAAAYAYSSTQVSEIDLNHRLCAKVKTTWHS